VGNVNKHLADYWLTFERVFRVLRGWRGSFGNGER
jgi:hypothetical protein